MTPLVGTTNPSTPVGDKSGGERRAARAAAFQVFTKHETRDPRHGYSLARGASQREFRGFHETRITRHESRNFCRPVTASLFTIVHHCSRLFGIVQQKNITSEPVSPLRPHRQHGLLGFHQPRDTQHGFSLFLRRLQGEQPQARPTGFHESRITRHETRLLCFHETRNTNHGFFSPSVRKGSTIRNPRSDCRPRCPVAAFLRVVARHGASMARHGRPSSPAPATRPVGFSPATRHATWFFPVPPATPRRATPSPATGFFTKHETRITNHGLYAFVAAFLRVVARHRASMARHGRRPSPAPATRHVGFSPATNHATRFFPVPPATPRRATPISANGFFTNHETRNTNHGLYAFVAAFLCVVARHGAAMARHGRPPSPAPATRHVGFSPATNHATWFFPVPPATPRRATPSPANGFFTNHETRNTNHGLYAFLPTISRHFPLFFGPPSPRNRCPPPLPPPA